MLHEERKNITVTEDSRVLIGIGDSFVQGHGAYPEEVWAELDFDQDKALAHVDWQHEDFHRLRKLESENNFITQITKKHLKDFIPINFGYSGNGNRAGIKALTTLHPDLNIEKAKEKIVIFYVGQFCRFDFFNKLPIYDHNYFTGVWPHEPSEDMELGMQELWRGYGVEVWSEKTQVLEFISNLVELQNWCKLYNAKLIVVNSFEPAFDREKIEAVLDTKEERYLKYLKDSINWDNVMPIPFNYNSMIDLLCHYEHTKDVIGRDHFFYSWSTEYCKEHKSFTPNGYFTPCGHPTIKGHELIADTIFNFIKNG